MGPDRDDPALRRLLADDRWVRELARRIGGPARADDLAQDAWLATLQGRAPKGPLRSWFAAILRNLARQDRRGDARRRRREEAAARRDGAPAADDAADDAAADRELHRRLARALHALDEPYRSTVLLRYFEGLRAADIARRQDTPTSTVRNRLRRALAMLRARLRDRDGALLLAPLLLRPRWTKAAAIAAVLGSAAYAHGGEPERPAAARSAPRADDALPVDEHRLVGQPPPGEREELMREHPVPVVVDHLELVTPSP